MTELSFMADTLGRLLSGVPLTLGLTLVGLAGGIVLAGGLVAMRLSRTRLLVVAARVLRLRVAWHAALIQLFLIYYGLSQFRALRVSLLGPTCATPSGAPRWR